MRIAAIVAMSLNRVIGFQNQLPWHLPADLKHFKNTTWGKPILLGRKTFLSIGRALPGRQNLVMTRDPDFLAPGCTVVHSMEEALSQANDADELFIIGGATLYQQLMPKVDRLYLTLIHHYFEGDAFFPELEMEEWQEIERTDHPADALNDCSYSFLIFERKRNQREQGT